MANAAFNGLIVGVLAVGLAVTCRQVLALFAEARWIEEFRRKNPERKMRAQTRLLAPMARMLARHDDGQFTLSAGSLRSLLEPCSKLGVETIVVHPNVAPQGQTDEQAEATKPLIRDSMAKAGDVARPFGFRLAFENMLSAGRSQPCGAMAQLHELVDGLADNVGLCFDTGHAFANGLDLASEVRDSGDRLIALHVHNNDGEVDRHWPPGRGKIAWTPFLEALRETRFEGAWTLETMARGDEDPIVNREKTKAAISAWGPPAGADSP